VRTPFAYAVFAAIAVTGVAADSSVADSLAAGELYEPLRVLGPLLNTDWVGWFTEGPEVDHICRWEPAVDGRAVRYTKRVPEMGFSIEGFYYWDPAGEEIGFTHLTSNGFVSRGTVSTEGNQIVLTGTSASEERSTEFKMTFEVTPDGRLHDRFYSRSGEGWRPGHHIVYSPMGVVERGAYLGQEPPGPQPKIFAPGVVSTKADELNSIFSPDGNEFIFAVKTPDRGRHTLVTMVRDGENWSPPRVLPFSGRFSDADPCFSADGTRLFFISTRPREAGGQENDWDIWVVDRSSKGWGEPAHLGAEINSEEIDVYPTVTRDGTLYFSSARPGGLGRTDIYRARFADGRFTHAENLGPPVNTENGEGDIYVAPDESYIVFSSGRPGGYGRGDLYVSFRAGGEAWTEPANLGETVNSAGTEYCPVVSPDGRYLFFTSYLPPASWSGATFGYGDVVRTYDDVDNGLGNVYWVDAAVLDPFRPGR
jgi:Tol biopolymer transport system component